MICWKISLIVCIIYMYHLTEGVTAMKESFVITIGREFGSGGRETGEILAEKLGIYDYCEN